MADYASKRTVGARIKAARRARGIRSVRELADLLKGTALTESVLGNIETGRKSDLPLSDLLNIAFALRVPPSLLLAPLAVSQGAVDLPGLSDELRSMSLAEFDAWLSGNGGGAFRSTLSDERSDLAELQAFRELQQTQRELDRVRAAQAVDASGAARLDYLEKQISELTKFLTSAGWIL